MSIQRQPAPRTMFDLGEIIRLYPEREPWCAGLAPSKGRRCELPTNKSKRSTAMTLLDLGSKQLRTGKCVDDVLDSIAPCVLCSKNHQYQAQSIAADWKNRLHQFWSAQDAATATASQHQSDHRRRSRRTSVPSTANSSRSRAHARTETSHLAASSPNVSNPRTRSTASVTSERSNPSPNLSSTLLREANEPTRSSAAATAPREHGRRQPVEGDCGICIEPITRLSASLEVGDNTSRIERDADRELVWCRSSCGTNFHKVCMETWIAQPRTEGRRVLCPMCRARWQI